MGLKDISKKSKVKIGWEIEFFYPKRRHLTQRNRPFSKKAIHDIIRGELRQMGLPVHKKPYGKDVSMFYVRDDASLEQAYDKGDYFGIEIVTPPMPYRKAHKVLQRLFKYLERVGGVTTEDCGLHANISFSSGFKQSVLNDICYLIPILSGENAVLKKFKREDNDYCNSVVQQYCSASRDIMKQKTMMGVLRLLQAVYTDMADDHGKCISVNMTHVEDARDQNANDGWVEFRSMGNKNYHKRYKAVEKSVERFVRAMEKSVQCAYDFKMMKREMAKVLNK